MKEQFFTGISSIGVRHRSEFKPSVSDNISGASESEVEIPLSMLALVATAVRSFSFQFAKDVDLEAKVYAAIAEFLTAESAKPDFSASVYTDAYLRHITTLKDIKIRNARAYHALMATLFNECS
jgi:hypothetical protein